MSGETWRPMPGETATCPKCLQPDVPVEVRGGVRILARHRALGTEKDCYQGSGLRVERT